MQQDKFSHVEQQALRTGDGQRLDTIRFFRNANEIYVRYADWKEQDRFYFIPLKLDMTFVLGGIPVRMANGPIYLGTFIRNTCEHEKLFTAPCPNCGHKLLPYGFNGSPLSGRVDLEASCPHCGWDDYVMVSGWHIRSEVLKSTQNADKIRLLKTRLRHPRFKASTVEELLNWLQR